MQELQYQNNLGDIENTKLDLECAQSTNKLIHLPSDHDWPQQVQVLVYAVNIVG